MTSIEKNILDLKFTKYTQYYAATLTISFTYLIGIFILLLSYPLNLIKYTLLAAVSLLIVYTSLYTLSLFRRQMEIIMKKINKLNYTHGQY